MFEEIRNNIEEAQKDADVLCEVAESLEKAIASDDLSYRALALDENLKMWVGIKVAVNKESNIFPQNIKSGLKKLSSYVESVTLAKGVNMTDSYFKSLAEINRQISEGLKESVNANLAQCEAYYLAKCGLDMSTALNKNDKELLIEALHKNMDLWLFIKVLMKKNSTHLSDEVKNNLMTLSDYICSNSSVLIKDAENINANKVESFININKHISEGLLGHR